MGFPTPVVQLAQLLGIGSVRDAYGTACFKYDFSQGTSHLFGVPIDCFLKQDSKWYLHIYACQVSTCKIRGIIDSVLLLLMLSWYDCLVYALDTNNVLERR